MEKLRQTAQWFVEASGGTKTGLESSRSWAHGEEPRIQTETTHVRTLQDALSAHWAPPPPPAPLPHVARRVKNATTRCPVSWCGGRALSIQSITGVQRSWVKEASPPHPAWDSLHLAPTQREGRRREGQLETAPLEMKKKWTAVMPGPLLSFQEERGKATQTSTSQKCQINSDGWS